LGLEQLAVLNGEAMSDSSITILDQRTARVRLAIGQDFFNAPAPVTIELSGFATVKDLSLGVDSPSLMAQFMLELMIVEEVSLGHLNIPLEYLDLFSA
jgi:hypothetical protein